MRFNTILIASCLILLGASCNNTKSSKTIKEPSTTVKTPIKTANKKPVVKAKEEVKDAAEAATKTVKQKMEAPKEVLAEKTKVTKGVVEEKKEVVKESGNDVQEKLKDAKQEIKKTTSDKKAKAETGVLKKAEAKDFSKSGSKAAVSKQLTEQKMAMIGKYIWLKRICCGRMRKVTTPEEGEKRFMTLTEDGQVKYSGNSAKKLEDCTYEVTLNSRTFPERPMLKMTDRIDALMQFKGDTLLIDRGYIDLDKNYWLKVE